VVRRSLVLLTVASVASVASGQSTAPPVIRLVAAVAQMGPVGYRDPLGVVSPNGEWLAFTSGGAINVVNTAGGPIRSLARFAGITSIAWRGDDHTIVALTNDGVAGWRWTLVDTRDGSTRDAWSGAFVAAGGGEPTEPRRFAAAAWSKDGAKLAGISYSANGTSLWMGDADGAHGRTVTTTNLLSFPT